jgi:hypothetical protein
MDDRRNVVTGARYHWCADDLTRPGDDPAERASSDDLELTYIGDSRGCVSESDLHGLGETLPGGIPEYVPQAVRRAASLLGNRVLPNR